MFVVFNANDRFCHAVGRRGAKNNGIAGLSKNLGCRVGAQAARFYQEGRFWVTSATRDVAGEFCAGRVGSLDGHYSPNLSRLKKPRYVTCFP